MNREEFIKKISGDFNITPRMVEQLDLYKTFLQEQNKIHNLTRLDKEDIIYQEYFYDSIAPFFLIDLNNKKILDIGSGSGTPGIILKILFPLLQLTIIESNNKKIEFIKLLIFKLDLKNIEILNMRAELIIKSQRELFDIVTSRAVASLKILIEISTPYLKVGGLLIEPKGLNHNEEYNNSESIIKNMDLELLEIKEVITPKKNYIYVFKKNSISNEMYPREWKEIIK